MHNIAAVVIWYNPAVQETDSAVSNVLSYADSFKNVYIVDNSATDNHLLAQKIPNAVYIANGKNLGIATALNQGCQRAKEDGFAWAMTMDQDSSFEKEQLQQYLSLAYEQHRHNVDIKSFAPEQKDTAEQVLSLSKQIKQYIKKNILKKSPPLLPDIEYPNIVITSANIIDLAVWEEIGKFDEQLFIDEVDFDFCIRLRLANYRIVKYNTVFVVHTLGEKRKTIFSKYQYESDFRLFYIFRNLMIEHKRYGHLPIARNYKKEIWWYFRDYCIFDIKNIHHLGIFIRAYKDYKRIITLSDKRYCV